MTEIINQPLVAAVQIQSTSTTRTFASGVSEYYCLETIYTCVVVVVVVTVF